MAGAAAQAVAIETGRNTAILAAELGEQIKQLRRQVAALEAKVDPDQGQLFKESNKAAKTAANGSRF
ncbi:hypothetical protein D3C87_1568650 [compost metagenome]